MFIKTGSIIRMCDCGKSQWPPVPSLYVYTDGMMEVAHCSICNKTWDVKTFKELAFDIELLKES